MSIFMHLSMPIVCSLFVMSSFTLTADTPMPPTGSKPFSSKPAAPLPPKKETPLPTKFKPAAKPLLPPMIKPFGMPGVIGLQNDKWEGTDYLGYLSSNIGISVEILKTENVPQISDSSTIENRIAEIFTKENINPRSDAAEGPPLPFLHVLMIVYPVERDRYVVFGNARLFEQIQVIRKDFIPAGYWQGITWETQDIALANGANLDAQLKALGDKLSTAFAKRYQQYNLNKESLPVNQETPIPAEPGSPINKL